MAYKDEKQADAVKVTTPAEETTKPQAEAQQSTVKELRISLKSPTKIDFIVCNTGERNTRIVHENKFILSKGTLFKIPLVDKTANYANANLIRLIAPFTESIRVLDVLNGVATIEAILHGSFIENGQLIGYIY